MIKRTVRESKKGKKMASLCAVVLRTRERNTDVEETK